MEPGTLSPALVVAGTFLPVIGAVAIAVLGLLLRAPGARRAVLLLGPLALAAFLWWVCPAVFDNGNMLAAALYMLFWVACALYYPIVIVTLAIRMGRRTAA